MSPIVALEHVNRTFGHGEGAIPVLRDVTCRIYRNEMVAIVGPSGSGKSTLMNIVGLLDRPSTGKVQVIDHDVTRLSNDKLSGLRGRAIGFVFQSYNLLPRKTALENVELPLIYAGVSRRQRRERAMSGLQAVGLAGKAHQRPSLMSGGEQQRVAIARALVRDPPLLLADEPTGALDSQTGSEILAMFHELHRSGRTVILITHDLQVAQQCERIIRIKDGQIL